jgi:hypothetical protein
MSDPRAGGFRLYPTERHWWSFRDYEAVLAACERTRAAVTETEGWTGGMTALEFGPGSSTLALVEGGCASVDCLEDDPRWHAVYLRRTQAEVGALARVSVHLYRHADPVAHPPTDGLRYDVGHVDGPLGSENRGPSVRYCVDRCRVTLVDLEDWGCRSPTRSHVDAAVQEYGMRLEVVDVGRHMGHLAVLTHPPGSVLPSNVIGRVRGAA